MTKEEFLKEMLISATEGLTIFDYYRENISTDLIDFENLKIVFGYYLENGIIAIYYNGEYMKLNMIKEFLKDKDNWSETDLDYRVVLSEKGLNYLNKVFYEKIESRSFPEFNLIE
jgi:hypothetical protein